MSEKFTIEAATPAYIEAVSRHLGYVRQWILGYEGGGGKFPPTHADALRKAQIILDTAKPVKKREHR